jgi:hypothetical protein
VNVVFLFFAIALTFFLASCGFFGGAEEVGQPQSGRTVYRSASDTSPDAAVATPAPQKVPGESR